MSCALLSSIKGLRCWVRVWVLEFIDKDCSGLWRLWKRWWNSSFCQEYHAYALRVHVHDHVLHDHGLHIPANDHDHVHHADYEYQLWQPDWPKSSNLPTWRYFPQLCCDWVLLTWPNSTCPRPPESSFLITINWIIKINQI